MAEDRNKALQKAEKLLRQGKTDQALKAFQQLVKSNPKDMNLKNRVADVYVRAGDSKSAIESLSTVGDFYSEEGFYLKAIAIFKKINKLDPGNADCYFKLADLYAKQGLNHDAKNQFQAVADLYAKEGKSEQAAEAIEKLLEIEPDNIKMHLRLAEMQLKLGQTAKGLDAYRLVGAELFKKRMFEEAVKIYEKGLQTDPGHGAILAGLGAAFLELGRPADTIDRAGLALPNNPDNVALLAVLADAYQRTGKTGKANELYSKLSQLEPDNTTWSELAGQGGAAAEPAPEPTEVPDLSDMTGDFTAEELQELSGEWNVADLAPQTAVEPEPISAEGDSEKDEFIAEHLTEAEVFIKYGLVEKAIDNLETIVGRYSDHVESLQRLKDLYLENGDKTKAAERCVALAHIAKAGGDMELAMDLLAEARAHDADVDVDRTGAPKAEPAAVEEFAFDASSESSAVPVEMENGPPPSGIELEFDMSEHGGADAPPSDMTIDFSEPEREPEAIDFEPDIDLGGGPAKAAGDEAIEFFDDAIRPDRRDETPLGDSSADLSDSDDSVFEQETEFLADAGEKTTSASSVSGDESLDQIFEEFKKGVDAQLDNEDYETHYNLGIAYKEMGLVDEAIAEFQLASKDKSRFLESCTNLGECFRDKGMPQLAIKWYEKAIVGLEEDSPQYIAISYVLGEAFEESGDKEKALDSYMDVFGLDSGYRDVADKLTSLEPDE